MITLETLLALRSSLSNVKYCMHACMLIFQNALGAMEFKRQMKPLHGLLKQA